MIYSKTPLRLSLFGGGTDLNSYYKKNNYGCVLSFALDKYIYVFIKKQPGLFYEKYRLNYSKTEIVNHIKDIKHDIIRSCLKYMNIKETLYISTISDVPASTGLGSSSAFCVGLLNALHKYKKISISKSELAYKASQIEIKILKKPIGIQDYYPAVYGGLRYYKFKDNNQIEISKNLISNRQFSILSKSILVFWSGVTRSADKILKKQNLKSKTNKLILDELKSLTNEVSYMFYNKRLKVKVLGEKMDEAWKLKKRLSSGITNKLINIAYNTAKKNGAYGGKILGAGGGGFLLLIADNSCHKEIEKEMNKIDFKKFSFSISFKGSISKKID